MSYGDLINFCFGDVERCGKGVIIRFNLKFKKYSFKCYVFSNGGEEAINYGYVMWFENNKFYIRISNKKFEWIIFILFIKVEEFM